MWNDQSYAGTAATEAAQQQGIRWEVVKLPNARKAFALFWCCWVVERTFGWTTRFRRLVRDLERLPETVADLFLKRAFLENP